MSEDKPTQLKIEMSTNVHTKIALICVGFGASIGAVTYQLIKAVAVKTVDNVNLLLEEAEPIKLKKDQPK